MAQYKINHTCGHSRTIQMYGPIKERARKAAWLEEQDCPQCWGAAKRAADAKLPITATIYTNGLDKSETGDILAEIVLTGGTTPRKEDIKALGYKWGQVRGGVMDLIGMSRLEMAWIQTIPLLWLYDDTRDIPEAAALMTGLRTLNATVDDKISPLDIEMARKSIADTQTKKEELAQLQKPEKPACYPSNKGYFNGKIYGNDKYGYRVYIDNVAVVITTKEMAEIKAYQAARDTYIQNKKAIEAR